MEGGFASRNGNTSNLSASITPTCKFYFCSQALAVMVKTMEMCQWAALYPISPWPLAVMVKTMEMCKWAPLNPI